MAWEWLAPSAVVVGAAASFTGARVGAKANREASSEATTQRELQARRDEWGRRFTAALERTGSFDTGQNRLAVAMMAELLRSELATDDDRELARAVYEIFVDLPPDLALADVDDTDVIVDDGAGEHQEGGQP